MISSQEDEAATAKVILEAMATHLVTTAA